MKILSMLAMASLGATASLSHGALVAYNDFNSGGNGGANAANVTAIGANANGDLLNQADGTVIGHLTVASGVYGMGTGGNPSSWPAGESATAFGGMVNNAGGYAYGNGLITFSGLSATGYVYELLIASNAGNQPTNTVKFVIGGAQSFLNVTTQDSTSSISTTAVASDSATITQIGGNVAHFTSIVPASDGTFSVNMAAGVGTSRVNSLELIATPVPEPAGLSLLGLGSLAWLRRRRA